MGTSQANPTFGDLWSEPLSTLWERVVRFRHDEARWRREQSSWHEGTARKLASQLAVFALRPLARTPGVAYRRLQIAIALVCFIRGIDHIIDPNDPHRPLPGTQEEHFEQATRLARALRNPEVVADEIALPEMVMVVYAYRAAKELLGIDMAKQMLSIWKKYEPDARRMLRGELFADQATLDLALESFGDSVELVAHIAGAPTGAAHQAAGLWNAPLWIGDMLTDFLADMHAGNMQVSREELERAGIDINRLLQCETYDDLAELDGFPEWFYDKALRCEQEWQQAGPEVEALLLPHIVPRIARRMFRHKLRKPYRSLRIERRRFAYEAGATTAA